MNVSSNAAAVSGVTTTLAEVPTYWEASDAPLYTNARRPPVQGLIHKISLAMTVTAGSPTKVYVQGYWDDTPAGAPIFGEAELTLKVGPVGATQRVVTAVLDAFYEMPKPGSAPNSSADGLFLWIKTDTGTVTINYAEVTYLELGEVA